MFYMLVFVINFRCEKVKLTTCQRKKKNATESNLCLLKKYKFKLFSCVCCRKPKYCLMLIRVKIRFELPHSWSLNPSLNHQYKTNYTGKTPVLLCTLLSELLELIGLVRHQGDRFIICLDVSQYRCCFLRTYTIMLAEKHGSLKKGAVHDTRSCMA